ncbi:hypothetical protein GW17_00050475 [Ensete ventricosum]|nr:hypothetical protein GW17_00050475 [Ensete ventricosum]
MAISRRSYPFCSPSLVSRLHTLVSDRQVLRLPTQALLLFPFSRRSHSSTGEDDDTGSVLPPAEGNFVRTVIPAHLSFDKDCAAIRDLSSSILTLNESRLRMELNFMLAYGAAESSIRLLQKFKLLDILLPIQVSGIAAG